MEVVGREDKESLLPPGEEPVPLVPDNPLADHLLGVRLTLVLSGLLQREDVEIGLMNIDVWPESLLEILSDLKWQMALAMRNMHCVENSSGN